MIKTKNFGTVSLLVAFPNAAVELSGAVLCTHGQGRGIVGLGRELCGVERLVMKTTVKRATELGGEVPTNGAGQCIEQQKPYRIAVQLEGVCPLFFHRWNNESVEAKSRAKKGSVEKKTDDIESFLYRDDKGFVSIPGEYIRQSVIHASKYEQDPRSPRKSLMDLMKAALVSLTDLASTGLKEPDYIDKRRVVIQRSAITRSRPALKEGWKADFILMVNLPEYIPPQRLNHILQQAGRIVGIADFRPSYGRFSVTRFEILDD